MKNEWWQTKAKELQHLADTNDARGFFNGTKAIYGPISHGTAPLKSSDGLHFKNAAIVTIYKHKDNHSECGNYRGISLLCTAGKILTRIMATRLQPLAERILPETQSCFRTGCGTSDMIFALRQLQEKCREQYQPFHLAFIDLTKAFDSVSRDLLWKILARFGCPGKFVRILELFHTGMQARILTNCELFPVKSGVKQGYVIIVQHIRLGNQSFDQT